ncbi:peptidylprolyl isomerase [Wolbachia endosymbiont of Dipetalonema caudispina]|uniref:SurA N-terminal domain-containing protein n=1 Tax=Wolbachia endosymbiont of Dipetalonema caudispina TaxID=1812112 RepID=UPI00158E37B8|nr:SurA N-terminal domain-containing protein [Wolbachia endosymbiont of Dipetalonema caudispina]QKX00827.1 peptidylprolyl isomerase [Wolbachia endosymbiont of Dipetalonema caudispina]
MHKTLILLIMTLSIKLFAAEIAIIADVNGEPISNLDIEKRMHLISSLFGEQDKKELKFQTLKQLIDEIIILNEAQRLNIKLSSEELNNATISFFTRNFKIQNDKINQYIKKYNIDLILLKRQIKCQLLWNKIIETKIIPFINISNKEVSDMQEQIKKPDYLITFQEFIVLSHRNENVYNTAKDLVKKLRNSNDSFIPRLPIKIREMTVNLNHLKDDIKNLLREFKIGDIVGPVSLREGYYSIIKIIDKVQLNYTLLESTLKIKQIVIKDSESLLENFKKQQLNCLNFNKVANNLKLPDLKEFEIKVRSLNPTLQVLFSKIGIDEIIELRENDTIKLMMLCGIKNNAVDIETVKWQIYQQKIMTQSNLLLESMRKNVAVSYQ